MVAPIKVVRRVNLTTIFLSVIGLALSGYTVYVSYRKSHDEKYKAYCDISEEMSCSKVFTSKYGKGFGFLGQYIGEHSPLVTSNGVYGVVFYILVILLSQFQKSLAAAHIQRILLILSNVMSIYLGYILYFVLKDLCVVCISTYVLNFLLTVMSFVKTSYLESMGKKKGGKGKSSNASNANQNAEGKSNKGKDKYKNFNKGENKNKGAKSNKINKKQN